LEQVAEVLQGEAVDGFLIDLGASSHQFDSAQRGFSFMHDGPLDMRMGAECRLTAEELINSYSRQELAAVFRKFGELRQSAAAAKAICAAREKERIDSTGKLRRVLTTVFSGKDVNSLLARAYQAIRIEINGELEQLLNVLPGALDYLSPGGRLVVISYHSLEDRIVKRSFNQWARGCICPPGLPACVCGKKPSIRLLTKKAVKASPEEIKNNSRARSARLRAAEKI
jgi:16S rRNA (cytosine1402-N4)-methyltransferase